MNAEDVDAVVKRANAAGYDSLAAYAVALEAKNAALISRSASLRAALRSLLRARSVRECHRIIDAALLGEGS